MKTKILLLIWVITLIACSPQKKAKRQIIRYNFNAGIFDESNIKPIHGKPTVLEICNINNLFYKVEIESKDVAVKDSNLFDTEEPPKDSKKTEDLPNQKTLSASSNVVAEVQAVAAPKISTLDNNDFTRVISSIQNQITDNMTQKSDLDKKIVSLKSQYQPEIQGDSTTLTQSQLEQNNGAQKKNSKLKDDIAVLQSEIDSYNDRIKLLNVQKAGLENQNKNVQALIAAYYDMIKDNYADLYRIAQNLYRINENYNNYIDKIYRPELTKAEYDKIKNQERLENCIVLNKEKLSDFYGKMNQFDDIKSKLMLNLNDITLYKIKNEIKSLRGQAGLDDFNKDIDQIKKDAEIISKNINELNIRKKLNYVETLDRILSNEDTYKYISVPIQGFEDYLKFNVTVISKTKSGEDRYIIDRSKSFEYKEYLKGGIRFDFSIGTVFDIGNKQQEFEVIQDVTGYKIIQTTNNQYIPTIAGMLHTSWRSANNFSFSVTLGVSMDMTKLQLNSLFPGVSLMIGKTDKIIFTTGPALRKVTELQTGFITDQSLSYAPQDYTAESYRLGWFVGVSWNLTPKQKSLMRLAY